MNKGSQLNKESGVSNEQGVSAERLEFSYDSKIWRQIGNVQTFTCHIFCLLSKFQMGAFLFTSKMDFRSLHLMQN